MPARLLLMCATFQCLCATGLSRCSNQFHMRSCLKSTVAYESIYHIILMAGRGEGGELVHVYIYITAEHAPQINRRRKWMATCCKCLSINKNHCLLFCAVLPPGEIHSLPLPLLLPLLRLRLRLLPSHVFVCEFVFVYMLSVYLLPALRFIPIIYTNFEPNSCHMCAAGGDRQQQEQRHEQEQPLVSLCSHGLSPGI